MPPQSFRLETSSGFCHPASIPTRPSFLGCHNWRQISGVLEGRWRFTESLGLGGSLVLSRALASILFDVRPTDVSIYGGLFVVLGVTAMLATYVPALRATRVEPLTALRYE